MSVMYVHYKGIICMCDMQVCIHMYAVYIYNCSVFLVPNFQIEYRQILSATTQNLVKVDALLFWVYSDTWEALLTFGSGVDSSSVSVTKAAASSSDDSSSSGAASTGASVASASGSSPATSPATSS